MESALREALIALAEKRGWIRYASAVPTQRELEKLCDCGEVTRGRRVIQLLGQTDGSGDTYGSEDTDGDLLVAPYQAGSIHAPDSDAREFEAVMFAAFPEIPDSYAQVRGVVID